MDAWNIGDFFAFENRRIIVIGVRIFVRKFEYTWKYVYGLLYSKNCKSVFHLHVSVLFNPCFSC